MTEAPVLRARIRATVGQLIIHAQLDTSAGPLVVVGPNGSGKTSVLSLILGVLAAEEGHIQIGDRVLLDTASGVNVPVEQRRIGYVPQHYALFPHLTVRGNVELALACASPRRGRAERRQRADEILHELALEAHAARRPTTLSGGEQQRVALARALSVEPSALLLDEPLAALDVHSRAEVRAFLSGYLAKLALPTIVVTHDALDAQRFGRRIAVLEEGKVSHTGTWSDLGEDPATPFLKAFIASASHGQI